MTSYRFYNIEKNIIDTTTQRDLLANKEIVNNNFASDINAFNRNLDRIYSDITQRQNLDKKIAQLKAESRIPDPDKLTLNQFISGLSLDLYDMCNELINKDNVSVAEIVIIIDKNYRKLTILIIILMIFLLVFYILSIKSYLLAEVRTT